MCKVKQKQQFSWKCETTFCRNDVVANSAPNSERLEKAHFKEYVLGHLDINSKYQWDKLSVLYYLTGVPLGDEMFLVGRSASIVIHIFTLIQLVFH